MMIEIVPFTFEVRPAAIAGTSLWSLALYLCFPISDWVIHHLNRWLNYAERSLYLSQEEFERDRIGREAQNAFYASIFSIFPFLVFGGLCNLGVELTLGQSWATSTGILVCLGCALYELGRRDG